MDEQLFARVLAGEHGEDLSSAESEAFEAWLETDQGIEALARAEGDLDPLADAYDPADPGPEAWERIEGALREAAAGGVVVRVPTPAAERSWGLTALLAAGLLFAAAIGLVALGPGEGDGSGGLGSMSTAVIGGSPGVKPLNLSYPSEPLAPLAPPAAGEPQPAKVAGVEAGPGYEVTSELVKDALLVITVTTSETDEGR